MDFYEKYGYMQGKPWCVNCLFNGWKFCKLGYNVRVKGCGKFCPREKTWSITDSQRVYASAWMLGDDVLLLYKMVPKLDDIKSKFKHQQNRDNARHLLGDIGYLLYFHTEVLEEFVNELNRLIKGTSTMKKEIVKSQKVFAELPPCNEKSLFNFICQTMHAVATDNISTDRALAISKLSSNAIQLMRNEIERGKLIEVSAQNGRVAQIRELSMKGFDDTTKFKDNQSYYIEETSTTE